MESASAHRDGPARRRVSILVDVLVFTALFSAAPALFSLFLPGELAPVGVVVPCVYAWWRGAIPPRFVASGGLTVLMPSVAWYASRRLGADLQDQQFVVIIAGSASVMLAAALRKASALEPS